MLLDMAGAATGVQLGIVEVAGLGPAGERVAFGQVRIRALGSSHPSGFWRARNRQADLVDVGGGVRRPPVPQLVTTRTDAPLPSPLRRGNGAR
jgi:hypothetical protein